MFYSEKWKWQTPEEKHIATNAQSEHSSHVAPSFSVPGKVPSAAWWEVQHYRTHPPLYNPIIFRIHLQILKRQNFNHYF